MTATPPKTSRVMRRLLDKRRKIDYLYAFGLAAFPLILSWLMEMNDTDIEYDHALNFTTLVIILPGLLWLLRWAMGRIVPVLEPWPPSVRPPILELLDTEAGKKNVYEALQSSILSPRIAWAVLLAAITVQVLDMWALIYGHYLKSCPPAEVDWTVMFHIDVISPQANLAFVLVAYSVQFAVVCVSFAMGFLMLAHNLFFLSRIYQRRWVPDGQEENYFQIDLTDDDRCFGFREANNAFNTQVVLLMSGGVLMLVTRFVNAPTWEGLALDPNSILPTVGQTILAFGWVVGLLVVAMPALVKLLPRLPIGGSPRASRTITSYLREFISPNRWPFGIKPKSEEIRALAARFASHSFWPTGNNRGSQLFFGAIWIGLVVFFTPPTDKKPYLIVTLILMGVLAYFGKNFLFRLLNSSLGYVDSSLVELPQGEQPYVRMPGAKLDAGVFVSYRRSDTAAYTGRLYDFLTDHFHRDLIFVDLDDIAAGDRFPDVLDKALETSSAMLVMIGPNWSTSKGPDGKPRLMNADDWVRTEVSTALKRDIKVVPVLVGGAQMPEVEDLPKELHELRSRNAHELSDKRWDHDAKILMEVLRNTLGPAVPTPDS